VAHVNVDRLAAFLRHEPFHGRSFARVRAAERGLRRWQRLALAALCPLLPFLLFLRTARRVFRSRAYRKEFLAASPLVFAGLAAWSWGELVGYLCGPQTATRPGPGEAAAGGPWRARAAGQAASRRGQPEVVTTTEREGEGPLPPPSSAGGGKAARPAGMGGAEASAAE
jgi:hypothetical protein